MKGSNLTCWRSAEYSAGDLERKSELKFVLYPAAGRNLLSLDRTPPSADPFLKLYSSADLSTLKLWSCMYLRSTCFPVLCLDSWANLGSGYLLMSISSCRDSVFPTTVDLSSPYLLILD